MSAQEEFSEANRLLETLFHTGHRISSANVNWLILQLTERAHRMVNFNARDLSRIEGRRTYFQRTQVPSNRRVRQRLPITSTATPLEKSKVIAKRKLEEPIPTECAICQEIPKYKDAVFTECDHYYCKACWQTWMNAPESNRSCPTCRKDMPTITSFRARASRTT